MLVLPLDTQAATLELAGGKGLNLTRLVGAGLPVPPGFVVTTAVYHAFIAANNLHDWILAQVDSIQADDPAALEAASAAIRARFATGHVPPAVAEAIRDAYGALGNPGSRATAVAVRSSATAEDLPDLSFAGQQDTFLNVIGDEALIQAVVACWSSLWTARAIGYRARSGINHADVALAVVVQIMVPSDASGVLFTADPLTGRRTHTLIDATLGLGEALVAGKVEPDHYVVDSASGQILHKTLGAKAVAIRGVDGGGTQIVSEDAGARQALPDASIRDLARLGQQTAALFGTPQDIEWGWHDGTLWLLQSRPITSLFPLPHVGDGQLRVWFSFGAVQGMLDPMTPLGQDMIKLLLAGAARLFGFTTTPEEQRVALAAGERLWINITPLLRHPLGRRLTRTALRLIEPGTAQALAVLWDDPRLQPGSGRLGLRTLFGLLRFFGPVWVRFLRTLRHPEAARLQLQARLEEFYASVTSGFAQVQTLPERLALLQRMVADGFVVIMPNFLPVMAGGMASLTLLDALAKQAGLPNALMVTRGLPHNVTTEMDLALWATAQAIRADADAADVFASRGAERLVEDYRAGRLPAAAQTAVASFLARYGVRGVAEIDVGRARWNENPAHILQVLQSYLRIADPSRAPDAVFERGRREAAVALVELETAVRRRAPLGWLKYRLVRPAARRVRALAGLRESPKFYIVRLMWLVRSALLASGRTLVAQGVLERPDDMFYLHLAELHRLAEGHRNNWQALVATRRQTYAREQRRRQIPRLMVSDGQSFYEGMAQDPADRPAAGVDSATLVGSAVSPGVVEGRVRVVIDPHGVQLQPGEILVCPGTDPAWTPLFLAAGGLVMEVGGMMTHGSVVAREYGIPAVVGVQQATTRLRTGQQVRVDGNRGRVVPLDEAA